MWVEVINIHRVEVRPEGYFFGGRLEYKFLDLIDHAYLFLSLFLGLFTQEVFADGSTADKHLQEIIDQVVAHSYFPQPQDQVFYGVAVFSLKLEIGSNADSLL